MGGERGKRDRGAWELYLGFSNLCGVWSCRLVLSSSGFFTPSPAFPLSDALHPEFAQVLLIGKLLLSPADLACAMLMRA